MKIMSWSVNGLVACKRNGFLRELAHSRPIYFAARRSNPTVPFLLWGVFSFGIQPGVQAFSTLILSRREPLSGRYGMGAGSLTRRAA